MNKILIGYSNPKSSLANFVKNLNWVSIFHQMKTSWLKFEILEDKDSIDQVYKNIKEINNKFANVDEVANQYIKLI